MKTGVGVGVMILENNKVLLGLRNPDKVKASSELNGEGTWTMPGGKLEFMETLIDAARRELKEETNLEAEELNIISITDDMTDTAHYVTVGFLANNIKCELKTMEPEAILEWKWFNLDNLPSKLYPPSKKLLDNYNKGKLYL